LNGAGKQDFCFQLGMPAVRRLQCIQFPEEIGDAAECAGRALFQEGSGWPASAHRSISTIAGNRIDSCLRT
jgi:hypothetical protein